ncbi:MAG: hypothetical protein AAB296_02960, partial [Candidatus Desantisbacteria bacterium]
SQISAANPQSGRYGDKVTVIGNGYDNGAVVQIDFGIHYTVTTTQAQPGGTFSSTFQVDTQAYGTKAITASGGNTLSITAFTILPRITLVTPETQWIGRPLTVEGVGYGTQTLIGIDFGTHQTITTTISSENGTFSVTFLVSTQPYSTKQITARDLDKGVEDVTQVARVRIRASLYRVQPASGENPKLISFWVAGWYALHDSTPYLDGILMTSSNQADSEGHIPFVNHYTIDNKQYGTRIITVEDPLNPALDKYPYIESNTFYVIPNIDSIDPVSGPVGSVVTITGSGFQTKDATVRIDFGVHETITTATLLSTFKFSTTFKVDGQLAATKVITATQGDACATTTFYLKANITGLTPTLGPVGTEITLTGAGYGDHQTITVAFGTHQTITTAVTVVGTFSCTFLVSTQVYGATTITAEEIITGEKATTVFNLTSKITSIKPVSGIIGSIVTVEGTGYKISNIIIDFGSHQNAGADPPFGIASNGTLSTTFIVSTQVYGTKVVTAYTPAGQD